MVGHERHLDASQFNDVTVLERIGLGAYRRSVDDRELVEVTVTFDMRDFYLKDLAFIVCTAWDEPVFANLVSYIERSEIRPLLAGTFALEMIAEAQREFLRKRHIGNFVLVP